MSERNRPPGDKPSVDVPPKPHEFPECEDMPDVHDDTDEKADITNE